MGAYLASLCTSQPLVKLMMRQEEKEEDTPQSHPQLRGTNGPDLKDVKSQLENPLTPVQASIYSQHLPQSELNPGE